MKAGGQNKWCGVGREKEEKIKIKKIDQIRKDRLTGNGRKWLRNDN